MLGNPLLTHTKAYLPRLLAIPEIPAVMSILTLHPSWEPLALVPSLKKMHKQSELILRTCEGSRPQIM